MSNEESTILHEEALELLQRADELSFTPGKAALRTLVAHLAAATEDDVSRTAILMLRSPEEAAKQLWALVRAQATQLSPDQVETRCRALQLLGRLAHEGAQHWLWLPISESLRSPHDRVRRYAARALARCRAERSELETLEAALLAAWESESQGPELKAMAQALARIGGERSLARLSAMPTQSKVSEGHASSRHSTGIAAVERSVPESERMPSDPHLAQVIEDALHALRARSSRSPKQAWVFDLAPRAGLPPVPLILSCRLGLGSLLAEELRASSPRLLSPDRVLLPRGLASLEALEASRLWLRLHFDAGESSSVPSQELGRALVDLLCAPKAQRILAHYGPEALRYRIEWAAQGRRRQATRELVSALSARYPQWINDPEQRHWEFVAKLQGQQLRLELEPRFEDRRFAYRLQDVPAASHPTIAAALARLAQPQSQDMIWDPFVGSGTELIECARLAPGCRLLGSDLAAGALEAAKLNSEAAGVKIALQQADALSMHPRGLRLIVSNPPMGQRVRFEESADAFFSRAFRHFASLLGRGGALLWATSRPDTVRALGPNVGLQLQREIAVDMGGFDATLQRWERL